MKNINQKQVSIKKNCYIDNLSDLNIHKIPTPTRHGDYII